MFGRIKQIVWGALLGTLIAGQAIGQTATLLPNAKQQFFTPQGIPAASGTVDFYIPSTTTRKTTWKSPTESTGNQNTNPVLLDAGGMAIIYGDGSYRQVVKDADGNTIWDAVTASTGSGGGGGGVNPATGDGNLVGTVLAWSGWSIPNQYMVADGTAISRTTYPELLVALTQTVNVICTIGLPTLTGLANTAQVPIGATVEASCLAPGSTVIAKGANSLTMSNNASVSTAVSARIFFYGDGDRSTTFNLPDLRSTVVAGQDTSPNKGARNVLVPPYFPLNGLGAPSIAVTASLATSNLPPITPAGSISNGAITNTVTGGTLGATGTNTAVAAAGVQLLTTATAIVVSSSQATSTFTGSVGGGTSVPFGIVQPTMMMNYIIKVTPDANSSVATGVLSLGGMTGVIACGGSLTCTGNTITANSVSSSGSAVPGNVAFWIDPLATTLGSAPTYWAANPGSAALYSNIAAAALGNRTVVNFAQFSQGTPIPASEQFPVFQASGGMQTLVATCNLAAGDSSAGCNAITGYARSLTNSWVIGGGAVPVFGQGTCEIVNSNCWSSNFLTINGAASTSIGVNANSVIGPELNININKLSGGADPTITVLDGLLMQGSGTSVSNAGIAFNLGPLSVATGAKWLSGYYTQAGAAVNAFDAGPAGTGATQNSQPIVWRSTSGASATLTAKAFSDSAGSLYFDPSANAAINLRDGNVSPTTLFSTSAAYGGSGVKVVALSTAGVVTNTAAGVLATLTASATTVLHGNTTFSAVDLTADVTNSLPAVNGGTGQTAYVLGDTLYSPSANTLFRLPGNTTAVKQYLSQTGTGAASAAPVWATIAGADITGAALTAANDTNITLTLGGTPTTSLLRAASITVAWTGTLANARLATMATNTIKGNATSGSASPTDLTIGSCSTASSALIWTTNTGFGCNTSITAAAVPASGLTGATLASGVTGSSLTSVGTIATGVWQGTVIGSTYGGTGVNNGSSTITLAGNLTHAGAFATTITATATTNSTLPAGTHTLAGLDVAQIFSALQTISVAGSNQMLVKSSGANASFINIDTGGASQQAGFNLSINSVLNWQFIDQTNSHFLLFDSVNAITSMEVTPGATAAGIVAFGYTKVATSVSSASVTVAGGLGVAGKGYFGGAVNLMNYTVATLPTGVRGDTAYVTDAVACTFMGALTGGAAVVCPVFYNGAAWLGG